MNKNCCHAYAGSFCSVKLNCRPYCCDYFFLWQCYSLSLFYFTVLLGSLVEYSVKQCSALSISSNVLPLVYRLCWISWILCFHFVCQALILVSDYDWSLSLISGYGWFGSHLNREINWEEHTDTLLCGTLILKFGFVKKKFWFSHFISSDIQRSSCRMWN